MLFQTLFIRLFLAHLIGDFFLQPTKWVEDKQTKGIKSRYLYLHTVVHFALAYVLVAQWQCPQIALLVGLTHFAVDYLKSNTTNNLKWFLVDQLGHLLLIAFISFLFSELTFENFKIFLENSAQNVHNWYVVVAYVMVSLPTGIVIQKLTQPWQKEIESSNESLKNAGKWIGYLERFLILTFVFFGKFEAIGYLLAAKSVFRFGDLRQSGDRKMTEYILIGTLLSFSISLSIALLINTLLH